MNINIEGNKRYTGIYILDSYEDQDDPRISIIAEKLIKAIKSISKKSGISEEIILKRINSKLTGIKFSDEREAMIAAVNTLDNTLVIGSLLFHESIDGDRVIEHELTHLLGNVTYKNHILTKYVTGYRTFMKYPILGLRNERNNGFNEAAVEMFTESDNEYRYTEDDLGFKFQTNIPDYNHTYQLNANLIEQMLIANGTDKKDLFDGLFDPKKANEFINQFDKKTFDALSEAMTYIWDLQRQLSYCKRHMYDSLDPKYFQKILKIQMDLRRELIHTITQCERTIIDCILIPNLNDKTPHERQSILDSYSKFMLSERDYLSKKTGFEFDNREDGQNEEETYKISYPSYESKNNGQKQEPYEL